MLPAFLHGLRRLLFPSTCHVCRLLLPGSGDFCFGCRAVLTNDTAFTCPRCAQSIGQFANVSGGCANCPNPSFSFAQAIRFGLYEDTLRDVVLHMKHLPGENLAHAMGRLWAEHHEAQLRALKIGVVIPIPLHWRRRWRRGYNQSETLAESLAASLNLPCRTKWLYRCRATAHQTNLSATARAENVKGAFACRSNNALTGRKVLLIDDVLTTGNTANEAAKTLLKAGASEVVLAVLARR